MRHECELFWLHLSPVGRIHAFRLFPLCHDGCCQPSHGADCLKQLGFSSISWLQFSWLYFTCRGPEEARLWASGLLWVKPAILHLPVQVWRGGMFDPESRAAAPSSKAAASWYQLFWVFYTFCGAENVGVDPLDCIRGSWFWGPTQRQVLAPRIPYLVLLTSNHCIHLLPKPQSCSKPKYWADRCYNAQYCWSGLQSWWKFSGFVTTSSPLYITHSHLFCW